jgi:nitrite reductase/ring-hydroxylating ferredoxin subunit
MYLGGHVVYRFGTAVDRNAFVEAPEEFVDVGALAEFTDGQMRAVDVGAAKALVVRRGEGVLAISNVCSHAGGPLDEGELSGDIVTCPWHGSKFCVRDGEVRGGPATFSQPRYEARIRDGRVELKLAEVSH